MLFKLMTKVAIISKCLVGINLTYTNQKGSVFSAISCMITSRRHVRIDARNYCYNECVFLYFDTLNILFGNLYDIDLKYICFIC